MHADAWGALAQWVTALIAIGAAGLALWQVLEARATRKRVAQPNVVGFADHNPENWQYLDVVIRNFGQTPAYDIKIEIEPLDVSPYHNFHTGKDVGVTELYVPTHIPMLAPGQEWRTVWDSAVKREDHADKLSNNDVVGDITFWDKMNEDPNKQPPYQTRIWVSPKMYRNMLRLTSVEPAQQISEGIAKVAQTLESYHDDENPIWVYTLPGEPVHRQRGDRRAQGQREAKETHDHIISALTPEEQKQPRRTA